MRTSARGGRRRSPRAGGGPSEVIFWCRGPTVGAAQIVIPGPLASAPGGRLDHDKPRAATERFDHVRIEPVARQPEPRDFGSPIGLRRLDDRPVATLGWPLAQWSWSLTHRAPGARQAPGVRRAVGLVSGPPRRMRGRRRGQQRAAHRQFLQRPAEVAGSKPEHLVCDVGHLGEMHDRGRAPRCPWSPCTRRVRVGSVNLRGRP